MLSDDDSSSIEVLNVVKKTSAKLVMNEIIEKMHDRVIRKARNKLTKAIQSMIGKKVKTNEATISDASSPTIESFDVKKASTVELKSTILKLEQSELNGTNLSVNRNVKDNGNQLLKSSSNSTLSSNEVLERVTFYHDMEDMTNVEAV